MGLDAICTTWLLVTKFEARCWLPLHTLGSDLDGTRLAVAGETGAGRASYDNRKTFHPMQHPATKLLVAAILSVSSNLGRCAKEHVHDYQRSSRTLAFYVPTFNERPIGAIIAEFRSNANTTLFLEPSQVLTSILRS